MAFLALSAAPTAVGNLQHLQVCCPVMAALDSAFQLANTAERMLPAAGASLISEITPVPSKTDISDGDPALSPTGGPPVLSCSLDLLLCRMPSWLGWQATCQYLSVCHSPPNKMASLAHPLLLCACCSVPHSAHCSLFDKQPAILKQLRTASRPLPAGLASADRPRPTLNA